MATVRRTFPCRVLLSACLLAAVAVHGGAAGDEPGLTLQDMRIAGRVLGFQTRHLAGPLPVAILFDGANPASRKEASAISGLLGQGLQVDDLILQPVLLEQAHIPPAASFGAVVATSGVDSTRLRTMLERMRVPCLTAHYAQVSEGACIVLIRSSPTVSIIVNETNAASADVHFATAFRMMVREI